jgi:hypothetical protein
VLAGLFRLLLISTKEQIADFFTKAPLLKTFDFLLSKLGVIDIFSSSSLRVDVKINHEEPCTSDEKTQKEGTKSHIGCTTKSEGIT